MSSMSSSKKYSVSLPEELAETIRSRTGPGAFSAYVAEALEHKLAMDKLAEIVADFETDNDPITPEELAAAMADLDHETPDSRRHAA